MHGVLGLDVLDLGPDVLDLRAWDFGWLAACPYAAVLGLAWHWTAALKRLREDCEANEV